MTEPTDIDALIAEVRRREFQKPNTGGELRGMYLMDLASSLADALESTAAELRQERERADENAAGWGVAFHAAITHQTDLARAREVIDRIGKMAREDDAGAWNMHQPLIEKLSDV